MDQVFDDVQGSYDRVAAEYACRISGELEHKPLDRQLLDRFATRVEGLRPVCDLGCRPGHVAHYLHAREERKASVQKLDRFGVVGLCCLRGWLVSGSDTERLS